jgi:hypothetical protein
MLCVTCRFVTWGVLCHLTVTKILKARHERRPVPLGPRILGDMGQVEAHFGLFGDCVNLSAR